MSYHTSLSMIHIHISLKAWLYTAWYQLISKQKYSLSTWNSSIGKKTQNNQNPCSCLSITDCVKVVWRSWLYEGQGCMKVKVKVPTTIETWIKTKWCSVQKWPRICQVKRNKSVSRNNLQISHKSEVRQ